MAARSSGIALAVAGSGDRHSLQRDPSVEGVFCQAHDGCCEMTRRRDPVEVAAGDDTDLHEVVNWEPRSVVDYLAVFIYRGLYYGLHWIVLTTAFVLTLAILFQPALLVLEEPWTALFFALSVVPAGLLAAFIWYTDITENEPLGLVLATFLLAVLFATFAAVVNTITGAFLLQIPILGALLFYFLIVGPVEETVKLLAVRIFAYRSESFDAVIVGAVYGAIAGLGFAAIENAIYIANVLAEADEGLFAAAAEISTVRGLVGPGHVLYSAIAGYYLGLAKFNPDRSGPLVVKGLLIAAVLHATYNSTVTVVPALSVLVVALTIGIEIPVSLAAGPYIVLFNLAVGTYLYLKIGRYRRAYREATR